MNRLKANPYTSILGAFVAIAGIWSAFAPERFHEPIHATLGIISSLGLIWANDGGGVPPEAK